MKEFRKKITYVTSLGLLVFIGCGTPEPASKISSSVPAPQAETPMIGMGYNSMNARVTGSNCFENLPIETTAAHEAELDFYRNLGSKQLSNLLDAGIEIGFPVYPGVTVKGRARYAEEFASGRYAETMTLHFKAIGARTRVYFGDKALDSGFPIKPIERLLKLKDNSNAKLLLCGDRYISRIDKGLEFTASLKVEFNNEYQKKAYAAGFGAEILGGIAKLDVDASYEKLLSSSNVNVSLAIEQKGGSALDLLQLLPSKDWATDGFNENQIDLAAIPDSEKQILEELKTGITFLNCSFETRNSCYAIFRKISRLAQKIADGVKNDSIDTNQIFENGNLIPIAMNTDPYLKSNGMELLESKNDDDLALQNRYRRANELRGKLLEIYKSTKEARRRAENINLNQENFTKLTGIDSTELTNNQAYSAILEKHKQRKQRIDSIIKRADEILELIDRVEQDCWNSQTMQEESGIEICANGLTIEDYPDLSHKGVNGLKADVNNGDLYIDPRDLIGDPESFTEWCYYAYAPSLHDTSEESAKVAPSFINSEDILTIDVLMATAGVTKPLQAPSVLDQCFQAEQNLNRMITENQGALSLVNKMIYSAKPISSFTQIKSLDLTDNMLIDASPLAKLKSLSTLILDRNKIKTFVGLELIQADPDSQSFLSVDGNHISQGFEATVGSPNFKWRSLRFGKNPLTQIKKPIMPAHLQSLDLRGGIVSDVSGLALINGNFQLKACARQVKACPFSVNETRTCSLEYNGNLCEISPPID